MRSPHKPTWLMSIIILVNIARSSADILETFKDVFPGIYDNEYQTVCDDQRGVTTGRVHSTFTHVDIPALRPSTCFFVEQYSDNDPGNIVRTRIYETTLIEEDEILNKLHRISDDVAEGYRNGHHNPDVFLNLTREDLIHATGCDVVWRPIGVRKFQSSMYQDECFVAGGTVLLRDTVVVSDVYLSVSYRLFSPDDGSLLWAQDYNYTRIVPNEPIGGYELIRASLASGHSVRYNADLEGCTVSSTRNSSSQSLGGQISHFQLFNGSNNGSQSFFTFMNQRSNQTEEGIAAQNVVFTVYSDQSVEVKRILTGGPPARKGNVEDTFWCTIRQTLDSAGDVSFYRSPDFGHTQLGHYREVTKALREGEQVTFAVDNSACKSLDGAESATSNALALVGGLITSFVENDTYMEYSSSLSFPDDNGVGALETVYLGVRAYINGTVTVQITCEECTAHQMSLYTCFIHPQIWTGSFRFFRIGSGKAITCQE